MTVELRDYQMRAAKEAINALKGGKNVVLDMPTGSGKTITSLYAAHSVYGRSAVFTRTLSQYEPWERAARSLGLTFSGLYGKARVCKWARAQKKGFPVALPPCVKGARRAAKGGRSDLPASMYVDGSCVYNSPDFDVTRISELGIRRFVRGDRKKCGYWFSRKAATKVKLYTYNARFLLPGVVDTGCEVHIFDEFHNFVDINSLAEISITPSWLGWLKDYAENKANVLTISSPGNRSIPRWSEETRAWIGSLEAWVKGGDEPDLPPPNGLIAGDDDEVDPLSHLYSALELLKGGKDLWRWHRSGREDDATKGREPEIRLRPVDPGYLTRSLAQGPPWIALSGTPPSAAYMKDVLGLKDFVIIREGPPWSWTADPKMITPVRPFTGVSLSYSRRSADRERVKELVGGIIDSERRRGRGGITLVVAPSKSIAGWFKDRWYVEGRGTLASDAPTSGVIVAHAGGKLVEGVEFISGGRSTLKSIILLGVPFPNVRDPFLDDLAKMRGDRVRWDYVVERARIAVRQAVGRAIRGPEDRATLMFVGDEWIRLLPSFFPELAGRLA